MRTMNAQDHGCNTGIPPPTTLTQVLRALKDNSKGLWLQYLLTQRTWGRLPKLCETQFSPLRTGTVKVYTYTVVANLGNAFKELSTGPG